MYKVVLKGEGGTFVGWQQGVGRNCVIYYKSSVNWWLPKTFTHL